MFKSYLKIVLKNFVSHKLYSLINIAGLGIGLSVCLIIAVFVAYELSYDSYHENNDELENSGYLNKADRLYLVSQLLADRPEFRLSGNSLHTVAARMKQDFPQLEEVARFTSSETFLSYGDFSALEDGIRFVDPSLFTLFDFTWLAGNPASALNETNAIVLTTSLAAKYFGSEDPVGKTLTLDNRFDLLVTGVIADLPGNTHMSAEAFVPMAFFIDVYTGGRFNNPQFVFLTRTYLLLRDGADVAALTAQFDDFRDRYYAPVDSFGYNWRFVVQDIASVHLDEGFQGPNSMSYLTRVKIFIAIAISILLIAVTNFMNLSTARSSWRAVEVGMRRAVGANRPQLIRQFLVESVVMVACAMVVAILLTELLLPVVSSILFVPLTLEILANPLGISILLAATVLIGVAAGSYPAFYLSSYRPAKVLKGEVTKGRAGLALRNVLVVGQFVISITMIVVSVVVWSQLRMIGNLDLGFDRNGMVVVDLPRQDEFNVTTLWPAMANQLQAHSNIQAVTHSLSTPLQGLNLNSQVAKSGAGQTSEPLTMRLNPVQPNYFSTYKIAFVAGRGFTQEADVIPSIMQEDNPTISIRGGVILNESAVAALGWSASEAIGNSLTLISERVTATVIGVVKDTVNSARDEAAAMVYAVPEVMEFPFGLGGQASIRISGSDIPGTMAYIQDVWDGFIPDQPIDPQFSEALWNGLYDQENQQMQMFSFSALIAVLVACFGLYGLASFNAERRTKEIGVRKVMGGSVWSIVVLLTNDFSKLVLIANLIAWPVAWYAMNQWLANFAYRIDLTPMIFIGSGLIALCIAWVTVGGTAAKAASQRPVLALRYE